METDGISQAPTRKGRVRRLAIAACVLIVLGYAFYPPLAPLEKADLIGYAICHQIPDRSFHFGGCQAPLCARCTGTYLGVAIGFAAIALLRRWRAGEMLSTPMVVVMVSFIAIMGIDGLNSYLSLFGTMPTLYTPQNWLRAATGSLNGIALSMIVWPVFNFTLWRNPQAVRPLRSVRELLGVLAADALIIAVVSSEPAWLHYPVALLGVAGVLWMLTLVNSMILLILTRRESRAETWRDALVPLSLGLVTALIELTAMGTLRYLLTGTLGWPLGA